jgi:hypothetical protein
MRDVFTETIVLRRCAPGNHFMAGVDVTGARRDEAALPRLCFRTFQLIKESGL